MKHLESLLVSPLVGALLLLFPSALHAQFGEDGSATELIGDYVLYESQDPITDDRKTVVFTDSEGTIAGAKSLSELKSPAGQFDLAALRLSGALFSIMCLGETDYPFPMVMNPQAVWLQRDTTTVIVRFDEQRPEEQTWTADSNGVGLPDTVAALKFVRQAKAARKLALRYTDGTGSQYTHVFSLMGLTDGMERMSCGF